MRPFEQLTDQEVDELRNAYFWELLENDQLINHPSEITTDQLANHYRGINFVDEDFFCNL